MEGTSGDRRICRSGLEGLTDDLSFVGTSGDQDDLARRKDRSNTHRDGMFWDVVDVVVEESSVRLACRLGKCHTAGWSVEWGTRFVKSDVAIQPDPEDLDIDGAL